MKKLMGFLMAMAMLTFGVVGNASAISLDANNMGLTDLQGVFDTIGSSLNANTDERKAEVFSFQSTGATAEYVATVNAPGDVALGLYDINDLGNTVTLFDTNIYNSMPGDSTQVKIDYNTTGGKDTVTTYVWPAGSPLPTMYSTADFSSPNFGFYITSTYGTFYSQSALNTARAYDLDNDQVNDDDYFLTYEGKNDNVVIGNHDPLSDYAHWYIAAEAGVDAADANFADIVVQVESMQPVPEPGTMILLGLGLLGLVGLRRKIKK